MRDNRARRRAGRVIVDGWRETHQAMLAGLNLVSAFVLPQELDLPHELDRAGNAPAIESPSSEFQETRRQVLQRAGQRVCVVNEAVMKKIAFGQSPRGIVSEFEEPRWSLDELNPATNQLVLVLDSLEKPGNIGAAFRSADACGSDAVIMTPASSDRFNPNTIRSSLGAVFSIPSATASWQEALRWLLDRGYRVCAARVESSLPMWEVDLTGPTAIVVGSESHGLGNRWQNARGGCPADDPQDAASIQAVRIPMQGRIDSLNASVSAALLLYEARRQQLLG